MDTPAVKTVFTDSLGGGSLLLNHSVNFVLLACQTIKKTPPPECLTVAASYKTIKGNSSFSISTLSFLRGRK